MTDRVFPIEVDEATVTSALGRLLGVYGYAKGITQVTIRPGQQIVVEGHRRAADGSPLHRTEVIEIRREEES